MHGRFAAVSTILSGIPAILGRRLAPKNYYRILKIFSVKFARIWDFCTPRVSLDTKKAGVSTGLLMMDGRRVDSDVAELGGDRALSKIDTLTLRIGPSDVFHVDG